MAFFNSRENKIQEASLARNQAPGIRHLLPPREMAGECRGQIIGQRPNPHQLRDEPRRGKILLSSLKGSSLSGEPLIPRDDSDSLWQGGYTRLTPSATKREEAGRGERKEELRPQRPLWAVCGRRKNVARRYLWALYLYAFILFAASLWRKKSGAVAGSRRPQLLPASVRSVVPQEHPDWPPRILHMNWDKLSQRQTQKGSETDSEKTGLVHKLLDSGRQRPSWWSSCLPHRNQGTFQRASRKLAGSQARRQDFDGDNKEFGFYYLAILMVITQLKPRLAQRPPENQPEHYRGGKGKRNKKCTIETKQNKKPIRKQRKNGQL
ncbi:uncharacterized protein LOC127538677 [Antechinus flavipes]|uniref:uncharacterized protein LOC127538677 n=1 Tax=Antechinus flavipes TaxID=38775 RepID=UPI0022369213|nr:uncharacterized protein LOC127538677 [Antechinus flavipes]